MEFSRKTWVVKGGRVCYTNIIRGHVTARGIHYGDTDQILYCGGLGAAGDFYQGGGGQADDALRGGGHRGGGHPAGRHQPQRVL